MRFQSALAAVAAAALTGTAAADHWYISRVCNGATCAAQGAWVTDSAAFKVDFSGGCSAPPVPSVNWFCVDWSQTRGHFEAQGQPRRCLRLAFGNTDLGLWWEVPCDWLTAGEGAPARRGAVLPARGEPKAVAQGTGSG